MKGWVVYEAGGRSPLGTDFRLIYHNKEPYIFLYKPKHGFNERRNSLKFKS